MMSLREDRPPRNDIHTTMTVSDITKYIALLKQQGMSLANRLNERTGGWLSVLAKATDEALKPATAVTAAAIAYFALFSLFPVTLLSIAIASFGLGSHMEQQLVIQRLEFITPALGQLLGNNIDEIIKARGPVTGIALVGLIWSASTVFYTFTHTLTEIWGDKRRRAVWKRRGWAILFVLLFVGPVLFLVSFASSVFVSLRAWLPAPITLLGGGAASWLLTIVLDVAFFMVLYMILPHGTSTWREILPGAIGAGLLWELAKKAFVFFIANYITASNLVYGSVAAIIAILTWAYVSGLIFLFGVYLSVAYFQLKQKRKETAGAVGK
jgi:membrane protein